MGAEAAPAGEQQGRQSQACRFPAGGMRALPSGRPAMEIVRTIGPIPGQTSRSGHCRRMAICMRRENKGPCRRPPGAFRREAVFMWALA